METISIFKVTCYTKDEMRPLWDSKEVAYPNFICVEFYLDGEFEDSSGNKDFITSKRIWCSSSYSAHKHILLNIVDEVL